jgi:serine/threonine protein kinase
MDEDDLFIILADMYKHNDPVYYPSIRNQLIILDNYIKKLCKDNIDNPPLICNVSVPKDEKERLVNLNIVGNMIAKGTTGRIYTVKGDDKLIIKGSIDDKYSQQGTLHELFVNIVIINDFILKNPVYAKNLVFTNSFFICAQKEEQKQITEFCTKDGILRFNMIQERISPMYMSLTEVLSKYKIDLFAFITIIKKVMEILDKLYVQYGFRHNDLHTGNILVNRSDITDVKIIDFGISSVMYEGKFYRNIQDQTREFLFCKNFLIDSKDVNTSCLYDILLLCRDCERITTTIEVKEFLRLIINYFSDAIDIDLQNSTTPWLYTILLENDLDVELHRDDILEFMKKITYNWFHRSLLKTETEIQNSNSAFKHRNHKKPVKKSTKPKKSLKKSAKPKKLLKKSVKPVKSLKKKTTK